MMITPVVPRGYCKGVIRAINIAKETKQDYPNEDIYMLGMIVHNRYVVKALEDYGIICVEDINKTRLELLDQIEHGVVIFTAHGVSDEVKLKAKQKGLIIVDASCDDVINTQNIVKKYINENYDVIYIGKKGHPEAEAVVSISDKVHLIDSNEELNNLPEFNKVILTNQTTMSINEIASIIAAAKKKYPNIIINDEICNATRIRQEAISKLDNVDLMIVVGDSKSNNTKKLKEISLASGIKKVLLIESLHDLKESDLVDVNHVAITAGASTPTYLTDQVISALNSYDSNHKLIDCNINIKEII